MTDSIQKWIAERIGIILDDNVENFGQMVKDGNIMSQILCNYGIIKSDEICPITDDLEMCQMNLTCLMEALKSVGIYLPDTTIQTLSKGDGAAAYKLFYKLYLVLHDKSKLDFLLKEKLKEPEFPKTSRIEIKSCVDVRGEEIPYDSTKALYMWHRKNFLNLQKNKEKSREEYFKKFQEQIQLPELDPVKMNENNCKDIEKRLKEMFHDLPEIPEEPRPLQLVEEVTPDATKGRKYLKQLKEKFRKSEENKILQTYMHKFLLQDFQTKYKSKQDAEFHESIMRKVLRQSNYEKQMTTKLLEIYNQKDRIIQNRKKMNEIAQEKRDKRFVQELDAQNYNITLASMKDYNERKRILELHKKLYEQKMQRRFVRHHEICHQILEDLVDLSIKTSEYVWKYETRVPEYVWRNWTTLFVQKQKLLTEPVDLNEVLDYVEGEDTSEIFQQNYLDDQDFDNYVRQENDWFLEELENMYLNSSEAINQGENIMSHVVNKLLLVKYPKPPLTTCPNLPTVTIACAVIGLENDTHLKILQKVLLKRDIITVNQTEIVNYCLKCFLEESQTGELDAKLDQETQKGKKALKGPKKKILPQEGKKGRKIPKLPMNETPAQKETQTPINFPNEEILLTPAAQLGQIAYDSLNLGLEVSNYLFSKMLIEYIKTFTTLKGWVLVNYPENVADALQLELALTGKEIFSPVMDEADEEESFVSDSYQRHASFIFAPAEDVYIQKRMSRLFPIKSNTGEAQPNHSYLTSFVRLVNSSPEKIEVKAVASNIGFELENFSKVEEFYEHLNCKNSISYKDFDADTVKDLINLIIQDNAFGILIYNDVIQTVFECVEQKYQNELELLESVTKKGKKGKKGAAADTPKKPKSIVANLPRASARDMVVVLPGETNWEYLDLPLPKEFQKQLASFWEDIELAYLNDLKQIFFQFRIGKNSLIPYFHQVSSHMTKFITRPDNKQELLHRFQIAFNDLENDLREDDEFKTELHCRIMDFKNKMWEICTCRMQESEEERNVNIKENWYCELCVEIVNLFVSALQLEVDRFVSSIQLLTDYYTFMATGELAVAKYNKINLPGYQIDDKLVNYLRDHYHNVGVKVQRSPFISYMNQVLRNCLQNVNPVYQTGLSAMSVMNKLTQEPKVGKNKQPAAKPPSQEPKESAGNHLNMIRLNNEWYYAIEGEHARVKFRLSLLEARAVQELDEIVLQGETLFHGVYEKIDKRNQDELQSVNLACEIFHRATETCESVQPRLVISGAKFYMDGKEIMYNDVYQPVLPYLEETTLEIFFTIPQLLKLTQMLLDLAPNGSLPLKTFMYLIEDLVAHQSDTGLNMLLPVYWHHLDQHQLQDVLEKIFGNIEYINWKDFIIYNLELPFPSEKELLKVREQFRNQDPDKLEYVNLVQFNRVEFWFERLELDRATFSKTSIKNLLAMMFEIRPDCINYSALLLTFCKDEDPVIAAAKAFGLCIGKSVCWNIEIGLNYIELLRYQKFMEQEKSIPSEIETQSNSSEAKFPSNVDFPEKPPEFPKDSFDNLSEELDSIFIDNESMEEEETPKPPSLCYVLPFNIILTIMTAALPWHTRIQCVQDKSLQEFLEIIYGNCKNEEFMLVFTHDFFNNDEFKQYVTANYKFNVRSPASFVQMKIEKCFCKRETMSESDK